MKNNIYKILVLSDLKNSTENIVLSTISLAKMIGADIDFFHVKKPTDIVEKENQLSAKRSINKKHFDTDKQIKNLLNPLSVSYNQKISSSFSFGNVKGEILKHIEKVNPDIIVLGKRKPFALKLIGDNITDFILKNFKGTLFIAADKNSLIPDKELSLGILDNLSESFKLDFSKDIMNHSKKPFKSFKIGKEKASEKTVVSNTDVIEYVFEKNDNSINNLSNYLQKNEINLFCVNRALANNKISSKTNNTSFKDVIGKLNVSLLLSNN